MDIMPTILDLAGINHPHGIQGISYASGLKSGTVTGRPYAYLEDDETGDSTTFLRTIRTQEYRLSLKITLLCWKRRDITCKRPNPPKKV